jgi:hypothetical protein
MLTGELNVEFPQTHRLLLSSIPVSVLPAVLDTNIPHKKILLNIPHGHTSLILDL